MVYLTDGILKEAYDKCAAFFENGIDCKIHMNAYTGEHGEGFAESEFAGKYLDCCVNFYKQTKNKSILKHAEDLVKEIAANQHEDGYLGGYIKDMEWSSFSVWNQAFTVYGLISYYKLAGDRVALQCAEKCVTNIAHHYMNGKNDILDAPNFGTQHLAILITLPSLYELTKNNIYLDFMEHVFTSLKNSENNFFDFDTILNLKSKKGIENFTVLVSMVMYHELTGDEEALYGAAKYWDELNLTQIRRPGNGTVKELWTPGGNAAKFLTADMRPNETCVSVGWGELSALLFNVTKETKYIDAIEKALFNHIIGSLDNNGSDFAYYQQNYGRRITKTKESAYKCCRYRGFNAISNLNNIIFYEDDADIIPMVYAPAVYENSSIRITEETNYPFDDSIVFKISGSTDKNFKLRIPYWCRKYEIKLNGQSISAEKTNNYVTLKIKDGDTITLLLNTCLKKETVWSDDKKYAGYSYGNVVLAADSNICKDIYGAKNTDVKLKRSKETNYNLEFDSEDLCLADYASAGKMHDGDEFSEWILIKD